MNSLKELESPLDDIKINVKVKLAGLWASVMFCYIYADYFGLYVPGELQTMLHGRMAPFGAVTQAVLVGTSAMMVIPSVMIFLCLALKPKLNRPLNIVLGILYSVIILLTMWGWTFFILYGVVEVALTALVVWYAWTWPRTPRIGQR